VARARTTKKLAQRIDLNYFKKPTPLKRAKLLLSVLLPVLAVTWIAWRGASRDARVYSSGRMSAAHAMLEQECGVCHLQVAGAFSAKAEDRACLACHDGPIHHGSQVSTPNCATCHAEHRGRVRLSAASNESCAACHAELRTKSGAPSFAARIRTFENGHPQFAALRGGAGDSGTIKLNHAIHMKPIRRGPIGPTVQLECGDCHRPTAVRAEWPYADAKYVATKTSYADQGGMAQTPTRALMPRAATSGRELTAPVKFATACAGCHLLDFDKRFNEGVPHDKPEAVRAFLVKTFSGYITAHPAELRVVREPDRSLTGRPLPASARVLTPAQWVVERTAEAEDLLWRKTCKQCHTLSFSSANLPPAIASANVTLPWMPHARFDHDAHRGFSCVSCHAQALTSTETSDILLPGISTCQTCHAPGSDHVESRCFECHTYHDWSKRKEVRPSFTLPAVSGGER